MDDGRSRRKICDFGLPTHESDDAKGMDLRLELELNTNIRVVLIRESYLPFVSRWTPVAGRWSGASEVEKLE